MANPPQRNKVFISYSHKDKKLCDQLLISLEPLIRDKKISVWEDTQIKAGEKWKEKIQAAIASAKVAVLLVSPAFLASDFIAKHELPPLLDAAENEGLTILWIALRYSAYADTKIEGYHAVNDPDKPLANMSAANREKEFVKICNKIKAAVTQSGEEKSQIIETRDPVLQPASKSSLRQRMVRWYQGLRLIYKIIAIVALLAAISVLVYYYQVVRRNENAERVIVLGYTNHSIDNDAGSLQAKYQRAIADNAASKLNSSMKYRFRVYVPDGGYDQLLPALSNNKVDIAFMSPFQFLVEKYNNPSFPVKRVGIKILARQNDYYAVFLVHNSSHMKDPSDIIPDNVNKVILGPEDNSASTNVVPTIFLWKHGLEKKIAMPKAHSRIDIVKEVGSGKDPKAVGVISSPDWEDLMSGQDAQAVDAGTISNIYPIWIKEIPIPFDVVLVNMEQVLEKVGNKNEDLYAIYQALGESLDKNIDWEARNHVFEDFVLSGTVTRIIVDKRYQVMLPPGDHDLRRIGDAIKVSDQPACLEVYRTVSGSSGAYPLEKTLVAKGVLKRIKTGFPNEAEFELKQPFNNELLAPEKYQLQVELCKDN